MAEVATVARHSAGTLTLGGMGAQMHDMAPILTQFRARHPSAELRFREVFFSDPFGALRAGEVDAVTTSHSALAVSADSSTPSVRPRPTRP